MSKWITRFILAPPLILGGLWFLFLPFAFAGMRDPDDRLSWAEYLGDVVTRGIPSISTGLIMILGGIYLAAGGGAVTPDAEKGDGTNHGRDH